MRAISTTALLAERVESNIIKLTVTNNAVAVVEDALSLTGNHGLSRANPLERHYRDVLCGRVHTPQDDATRIGRRPRWRSASELSDNEQGAPSCQWNSSDSSQQQFVRDHRADRGRCSIRTHIETVAKAHELAGFDRALLAFHSTTPDALQIAQHVLGITKKLKVMIAQRPGFTAPTLLARQLATVDQLSGGRVSLHVITGGNATELRQDGNTLDDKDERYARTSEFLDIVRAEWTSEKPFDYDGKYYKVEKGFSQVKPRNPAASTPSSAAAPMPRSRSRASMPTRSRYGANPTRRCAT